MLDISLRVSPLLRVAPFVYRDIILLLCHKLILFDIDSKSQSAISAVCAAVKVEAKRKWVHFTSDIIIYPITLVCSLFYNLLGIYIHPTDELLNKVGIVLPFLCVPYSYIMRTLNVGLSQMSAV